MMRSRNEVEGMALKAARGAGLPIGHAEDFARAFGLLAAQDFDDLASQINALKTDMHVGIQEDPLRLTGACVMVMPMAIDAVRAGETDIRVEIGSDNSLAQAYLQVAAQDHDVLLNLTPDGQLVPRARPFDAIPIAAISVASDVWSALSDLAARTYVPASESSRLSGAGAGLTDND